MHQRKAKAHQLPKSLFFCGLAAFAIALLWPTQQPEASVAEWGNYVGAKRCQVCHQEAYDIWAKGPHARALSNLTGQQKQDFRCRQCHTMLADAPMEHLQGIQCESCHGPGRYYAESYIMQDEELRKELYFKEINEESCLYCHQGNQTGFKPWNYKEKLEKIRHW